MKRFAFVLVIVFSCCAGGATKAHVLTFGKWTTVQWFADSQTPLNLKVRALFVDAKLKEFTFGPPHEITDRLFVVRRALRVNDALPQEESASPRWTWQPGGWLLVDRATGRVSAISLQEFDPYYSSASWYRDYIAYCGISDDGRKLVGAVSQLGRRKLILRKPLGEADQDSSGADCATPAWQRHPMRVTFRVKNVEAGTYSIRGRAAMAVEESSGEEEADNSTE